ncbi:anti-sigma factor family protein [Microbaculum marinisediminis]|uniref:Anti-sigma factor n=1 Tax=Microbaculum marinisediminis TaxID=2931392 RepID=A0AAW5QUC5_9HYPH|nr:anti-sigma factor [Microbaculum sp. A6E488]MCT8970238.1 anti-sigma factor [Microbaculum sp. A6E488]
MTDEKTVSEDMLHAYVDGALAPEDVARVEAWLAGHPEEAAAVAAWLRQNALIRAVFAPEKGSPAEGRPEEGAREARAPDAVAREREADVDALSPDAADTGPVPAAGRPRWRMAIAASIATFAIGLGAGIGIGTYAPGLRPEAPTIAAQAETAYRVYTVEKRHPVEVGPDEREHLVKWLSNRLETRLALPDLEAEGLTLVGGRLTTGGRGPAALFMFEAGNGDRYTVYVTRAARADETAFRFDLNGDIGACYWLDRGVAVVVNGPADRDRLQAIANRVYDAYEGARDTDHAG